VSLYPAAICGLDVSDEEPHDQNEVTDLSGRLIRQNNLTHMCPRQKTMHKYVAQSRLGVWPDEIVIFIHV
jgi:hypothetical protein